MSFRILFFSAAVGLAVLPGLSAASASTHIRNIKLTRYNQEHNVDYKIAIADDGGVGSGDCRGSNGSGRSDDEYKLTQPDGIRTTSTKVIFNAPKCL